MTAGREWFNGQLFRFTLGRDSVCNRCQEHSPLERIAPELRRTDRLVLITSAGAKPECRLA